MALGKNIQRFREAKGFSQDTLARRTGWSEDLPGRGVSQGAISALKKRDSTSSKHAPILAIALGIQLEELLGINIAHKISEPDTLTYIDPVIEDLAALAPEDADVWRAQIRAAAIKARRLQQGENSEESERRISTTVDPPLESRRTA
jgi:transcriptional regulator with XRE-family HTH domain